MTTTAHHIRQTDLVAAVKRVIFARDTEGRRFALNCVLIEVRNGTCYVVATDGRRLAYVAFQTDCDDCTFLLPPDIGGRLCRMRGNNADTIGSVAITGDSVSLTWTNGRGKRTTATWDNPGRFPRWQAIVDSLPKWRNDSASWIECQAGNLVDVLTSDNGVTFNLNGSVRVGDPTVALKGAKSSGDLTIRFDRSILCDWLETVDTTESVTILITDDSSAAHCFGKGAANYVIMPMAKTR